MGDLSKGPETNGGDAKVNYTPWPIGDIRTRGRYVFAPLRHAREPEEWFMGALQALCAYA